PEALERLHLEPELVEALEIPADTAPAEHRVVLVGLALAALHVPELVGRGVKCADPDGLSRECIEHDLYAIVEFFYELLLFVVGDEPAGRLVEPEDQVLDPEQADTVGAGCRCPGRCLGDRNVYFHTCAVIIGPLPPDAAGTAAPAFACVSPPIAPS